MSDETASVVSTLSDEEAEALNAEIEGQLGFASGNMAGDSSGDLSPIVRPINDNASVEALLQAAKRFEDATDSRSRPIISYRQFRMLEALGARLDGFALRMRGPMGEGPVQASKYLKFFGMGYRPVEAYAPDGKEAAKDEGPMLYWCSDKYPECGRFFDSERSRSTHWGLEHKRIQGPRKAKGNDNG